MTNSFLCRCESDIGICHDITDHRIENQATDRIATVSMAESYQKTQSHSTPAAGASEAALSERAQERADKPGFVYIVIPDHSDWYKVGISSEFTSPHYGRCSRRLESYKTYYPPFTWEVYQCDSATHAKLVESAFMMHCCVEDMDKKKPPEQGPRHRFNETFFAGPKRGDRSYIQECRDYLKEVQKLPCIQDGTSDDLQRPMIEGS